MPGRDPEQHGERLGGAGREPGRALTEEQLAAIATSHSGLAEVSIQGWAILLRCKGGSDVAADELVASLIDWFPAVLSVEEISTQITRLVGEGYLARIERGRAFRTTRLGEAVLEQVHPPMIRGAMWMLGRLDEEGERDEDR